MPTKPAAKYTAALHEVLADTLRPLGRWQILDPVLASERTALFHAQHRPEPPPPGTRLWEIFIGLRGAGDRNILGDQLVRVLSDAGMHFGQLTTRFYAAGTEERGHAMSQYHDLRKPDDR